MEIEIKLIVFKILVIIGGLSDMASGELIKSS